VVIVSCDSIVRRIRTSEPAGRRVELGERLLSSVVVARRRLSLGATPHTRPTALTEPIPHAICSSVCAPLVSLLQQVPSSLRDARAVGQAHGPSRGVGALLACNEALRRTPSALLSETDSSFLPPLPLAVRGVRLHAQTGVRSREAAPRARRGGHPKHTEARTGGAAEDGRADTASGGGRDEAAREVEEAEG